MISFPVTYLWVFYLNGMSLKSLHYTGHATQHGAFNSFQTMDRFLVWIYILPYSQNLSQNDSFWLSIKYQEHIQFLLVQWRNVQLGSLLSCCTIEKRGPLHRLQSVACMLESQHCIHQLMCHNVSHHKSWFRNVFILKKIWKSLWHLMHSTKIVLITTYIWVRSYYINSLREYVHAWMYICTYMLRTYL